MNEEKPVYVIERRPYPDRGETYFNIWVTDAGMKISPSELSQLLANVLSSQVKPSATDNTSDVRANTNLDGS